MFEMKMKNSIHEQHAENNLNPATRSIASRLAVSCHSKHNFSSCVDDPSTHNTVARLNPATRSIASRLAAGSSVARLNPASGFTLIEVMVVIVILGVLAALIVPNVMGRGEKAKVDTTSITLKGVAGALDQYKLDNGRYPSMQDPKDSWENDLQYVIPGRDGRSFDLYSFGADGKEGGEGNDADIYYQP